MSLDHDAIRKAYPNAVTIDDGKGAFDSSGKQIELDNSKVTAARTALDIGDQLDNLYKDILAGTVTSSGAFATAIKRIKDKYPKP